MKTEEPSGLSFGNYEVLSNEDGTPKILGGGAFGRTYLARHRFLGTLVALKVIHDRHTHDQGVKARFLKEAQAQAKLVHPHIARITDFGETDGNTFYAVELCEGGNLQQLAVKYKALPPQCVAILIQQAAEALAFAHARQFVHRDIKPENLLLLEGNLTKPHVKIIDFGLVKSLADEGGDNRVIMTHEGQIVGTILFASPEQLREEPVDERSDIFSLGLTAWYLLVGGPPIPGKAAAVISAERLSHEEYESKLPSGLPDAFRSLLARMLRKKVEERLGTAAELSKEITRILSELKWEWEHPALTRAPAETAVPSPATEPPTPIEKLKLGDVFQYREDADSAPGTLYIGTRFAGGDEVELFRLQGSKIAIESIKQQLTRLQMIEHLNVQRYLSLLDFQEGLFAEREHLGEMSLIDLIKEVGGGGLSLRDAAQLLTPLASAMDKLAEAEIPGVRCDPSEVALLGDPSQSLGSSLKNGVLVPKLRPLLAPETNESELPSGLGTSSTETILTSTGTGKSRQSYSSAFAGVVYYVLSGRRPKAAARLAANSYISISGLSAEGNLILKNCLASVSQASDCETWWSSILQTEGLDPGSSKQRDPRGSTLHVQGQSPESLGLPIKPPPLDQLQKPPTELSPQVSPVSDLPPVDKQEIPLVHPSAIVSSVSVIVDVAAVRSSLAANEVKQGFWVKESLKLIKESEQASARAENTLNREPVMPAEVREARSALIKLEEKLRLSELEGQRVGEALAEMENKVKAVPAPDIGEKFEELRKSFETTTVEIATHSALAATWKERIGLWWTGAESAAVALRADWSASCQRVADQIRADQSEVQKWRESVLLASREFDSEQLHKLQRSAADFETRSRRMKEELGSLRGREGEIAERVGELDLVEEARGVQEDLGALDKADTALMATCQILSSGSEDITRALASSSELAEVRSKLRSVQQRIERMSQLVSGVAKSQPILAKELKRIRGLTDASALAGAQQKLADAEQKLNSLPKQTEEAERAIRAARDTIVRLDGGRHDVSNLADSLEASLAGLEKESQEASRLVQKNVELATLKNGALKDLKAKVEAETRKREELPLTKPVNQEPIRSGWALLPWHVFGVGAAILLLLVGALKLVSNQANSTSGGTGREIADFEAKAKAENLVREQGQNERRAIQWSASVSRLDDNVQKAGKEWNDLDLLIKAAAGNPSAASELNGEVARLSGSVNFIKADFEKLRDEDPKDDLAGKTSTAVSAQLHAARRKIDRLQGQLDDLLTGIKRLPSTIAETTREKIRHDFPTLFVCDKSILVGSSEQDSFVPTLFLGEKVRVQPSESLSNSEEWVFECDSTQLIENAPIFLGGPSFVEFPPESAPRLTKGTAERLRLTRASIAARRTGTIRIKEGALNHPIYQTVVMQLEGYPSFFVDSDWRSGKSIKLTGDPMAVTKISSVSHKVEADGVDLLIRNIPTGVYTIRFIVDPKNPPKSGDPFAGTPVMRQEIVDSGFLQQSQESNISSPDIRWKTPLTVGDSSETEITMPAKLPKILSFGGPVSLPHAKDIWAEGKNNQFNVSLEADLGPEIVDKATWRTQMMLVFDQDDLIADFFEDNNELWNAVVDVHEALIFTLKSYGAGGIGLGPDQKMISQEILQGNPQLSVELDRRFRLEKLQSLFSNVKGSNLTSTGKEFLSKIQQGFQRLMPVYLAAAKKIGELATITEAPPFLAEQLKVLSAGEKRLLPALIKDDGVGAMVRYRWKLREISTPVDQQMYWHFDVFERQLEQTKQGQTQVKIKLKEWILITDAFKGGSARVWRLVYQDQLGSSNKIEIRFTELPVRS